MNDYQRPAFYQVETVYRCSKCNDEQIIEHQMSAQMPCPRCGGFVERVGEAYPADSGDWHDERDNVNDEWRNPYYRR